MNGSFSLLALIVLYGILYWVFFSTGVADALSQFF